MSEALPATTTAEQNLTSLGQRHINAMWERTQQVIAVEVATLAMLLCAYLTVYGTPEMQSSAFGLMSTLVVMVLTFYFVRTNHTKTGGVGPNEIGR